MYELASIGTLLRNSGAPAAGAWSEFRHAQVRFLDSKISNSVRIAARSSKNRKGHGRKSTGTIEPSTICHRAGRSESTGEGSWAQRRFEVLPPAAIGRA